jgi:hypothetical protein
MDGRSDSDIPAFRRHATLFVITLYFKNKVLSVINEASSHEDVKGSVSIAPYIPSLGSKFT